MSEYVLTAKSPLSSADVGFDGVTFSEISDRAIVSVATPSGGEETLANALNSSYGTDMPAVGQTANSTTNNAQLLGLQSDQIFLVFDCTEPNAVKQVAEKLGNSGYLTDQSDSWVMIAVFGPKVLTVLERICPLDLHEKAFPVGGVARTVMEHLGTIIVRESQDTFLLLAPRSSAASFFETLTTAANNVL